MMFVLSLIIAVWVSGVNSTAFNNVAILRRIKTTFCSIGVSSAIVGASIIDFAVFEFYMMMIIIMSSISNFLITFHPGFRSSSC